MQFSAITNKNVQGPPSGSGGNVSIMTGGDKHQLIGTISLYSKSSAKCFTETNPLNPHHHPSMQGHFTGGKQGSAMSGRIVSHADPGDTKESTHLPAPLNTLSAGLPRPGPNHGIIEAAGNPSMNVTKPLPSTGGLYSLPLTLNWACSHSNRIRQK